MKVQFENKVMSSLLLFVDNAILTKGEAFTNHAGLFYPVENLYNNYYTYAAPFKQLVSDDSIAGATVMKTVYIDGAQTSIGNNGMHGINHFQGQVHFTSNKNSPSIPRLLSQRKSARDIPLHPKAKWARKAKSSQAS